MQFAQQTHVYADGKRIGTICLIDGRFLFAPSDPGNHAPLTARGYAKLLNAIKARYGGNITTEYAG